MAVLIGVVSGCVGSVGGANVDRSTGEGDVPDQSAAAGPDAADEPMDAPNTPPPGEEADDETADLPVPTPVPEIEFSLSMPAEKSFHASFIRFEGTCTPASQIRIELGSSAVALDCVDRRFAASIDATGFAEESTVVIEHRLGESINTIRRTVGELRTCPYPSLDFEAVPRVRVEVEDLENKPEVCVDTLDCDQPPGWAFYTTSSVSGTFDVPATGIYDIAIRARQESSGSRPARLTLSIDGELRASFEISSGSYETVSLRDVVGDRSGQGERQLIEGLHTIELRYVNNYPGRNVFVDSIELFESTEDCTSTLDHVDLTEPFEVGGLRDLASSAGVKLGCQVRNDPWNDPFTEDPEYQVALLKEFNLVTMGNQYKMEWVSQSETETDFSRVDDFVEYTEAGGLETFMHTLVWHESVPDWLEQQGDDFDVRRWLVDYITAYVGRYRGQIPVWHVVNEAISEVFDGHSFRESFWYERVGPDYVELAFRTAHAADPDARLFYNDFALLIDSEKTDAVFAMLQSMIADGVPVHGIGFQSHLSTETRIAPERMRQVFSRFAALGLEVQVTELDVWVPEPVTAAGLAIQAEVYYDVVQSCVAVDGCSAVTIWGLNDPNSWLVQPARIGLGRRAPLLLDEHYARKPAYYAVGHALRRTVSYE